MDIPYEVLTEARMAAVLSSKPDIAANLDAYQVIAEWARKEALREAESAVTSCGYVLDGDVTGFPSGQAVDRREALNAIRALPGS